MKNLKNKKVLVYGFGISGQGAINLLNKKGAKTFLFDNIQEKAKLAKQVNVKKELSKEFLKKLDLVVISPGVSIFNKNIELIKKLNIKVISELELGFLFCKGKIVAVTGTNGKTTTVKLIYNIFKNAGKSVAIVGNVGISFCEEVLKQPKDFYIVEVSSFQLEAIKKFRPNMSAILNITPDHINRHKTFENYKQEKFKIFKNQKRRDIIILNADDKSPVNHKKIKPQKLFFSVKNKVYGAYLKEDSLYYKNKKLDMLICDKNELFMKEEHNIKNILVAIIVGINYNIPLNSIQKTIKEFKPDKHRMQKVAVIDDIEYCNDSKATNADACIRACESFDKPIYLIIGGSLKGEGFKGFLLQLKNNSNVKNIVCYGKACKKIKAEAQSLKLKNVSIKPKFKDAFKFISKQAKKGSVVLLSPAFASFGDFENYKQRGEEFERLVKELKIEK